MPARTGKPNLTARYVAALFEAVGVDRGVTLDVHNLAAFHNAFKRTIAENIQATELFARYFAESNSGEAYAVISPDPGGIARAGQFRQALERRTGRDIDLVFVEKSRSSGVVRGGTIVGNVSGKVVIIIDDLIAIGGTFARAAAACRKQGAFRVAAAASHGLFVAGGEPLWKETELDEVAVTNTIPPWRIQDRVRDSRLVILDTTPLFAEVVRRMHRGETLEEAREYLV